MGGRGSDRWRAPRGKCAWLGCSCRLRREVPYLADDSTEFPLQHLHLTLQQLDVAQGGLVLVPVEV